MGLPSFKKMDAEGQKQMQEELTRMQADFTGATSDMDGINFSEAKEKEAEANKKEMANRLKKASDRKGIIDKALGEEKIVKEIMADIQKDIARLKNMLTNTRDAKGKLKIRTQISDLRDKYFQ